MPKGAFWEPTCAYSKRSVHAWEPAPVPTPMLHGAVLGSLHGRGKTWGHLSWWALKWASQSTGPISRVWCANWPLWAGTDPQNPTWCAKMVLPGSVGILMDRLHLQVRAMEATCRRRPKDSDLKALSVSYSQSPAGNLYIPQGHFGSPMT